MYPRQKRPFPARSAMLLAMLAATAAFWPPPAVPAERPAAREVRIGLYENAPKIHSDDEGRPAGLFVDLARAMAPPPAQVVPMELRWLLTGAAGLLLILVPASLFLRRKVGQQEKRLRLSEEKFSKAFHSNPYFTMISRLRDGRIIEANEGFEKLLGIPVAEAVGRMSVADLHMWSDPADRERFVRLLDEQGSVREFPSVFVTQGGERRDVEITANTIDYAGEPHIIGTARDVTELKRSQEALRRSEERFAKAFHANPSYASVSRLEDGKFVAVNQGFERVTGWKAQEVLGRTAMEIGLWSDPAERGELVRHLREEGEWQGFKVHFRKKNGEVILIEGSCVLTEIGGEPQIIGVARDITEVQRAEEALRQSEEKFAKVFHASPDGIMVVSLEDGLILDVNESFEKLLGYPRGEIIGHTTVEMGLWARPEQRARFIEQVTAQGRVSGHEFAMRTRDGSLRDMMTLTVVIDIGGTPCLISIARDIGDQRRAEEAIRNLNVALEHRVRERTAESGRGGARAGELQLFHLPRPALAPARHCRLRQGDRGGLFAAHRRRRPRLQLGRIIANAIRMGDLIDDLLDFSRIGRVELKRSAIDMAAPGARGARRTAGGRRRAAAPRSASMPCRRCWPTAA